MDDSRFGFTDLSELSKRLTPEYVAGFFDGEGSVYTTIPAGRGPQLKVVIVQCNAALLTLLAMKFGGSGVKAKDRDRRPNAKQLFSVEWTGRGCLPLLYYIKDHVILKKRLVESGIEFTSLMGLRSGDRILDRDRERQLEIHDQMKAMNNGAVPCLGHNKEKGGVN